MYFNENDKFPAAWLRNLYPKAHVDERSIQEVAPADVAPFTRCHFFGGIGGWEYALQLAGWPEDERCVWTGSCPCQPFSAAGKQKGAADERHLWPEFRRLIAECRPATIFGEQVASKLGREWLAGVRADLEALGYAVGAADLCAASAGAPHIRQRLFWVAHSEHGRPPVEKQGPQSRRQSRRMVGGVGLPAIERDGENSHGGSDSQGAAAWGQRGGRGSSTVVCHDGKRRRIPAEPGFFPLAHGVPARVGRLRAYGNAIVPQVAATFIRACFP